MRLIDADKLLESMNESYNEKKDIVSDTLAEGFMQMDKLIHEQDSFDLADHDKQIRADERNNVLSTLKRLIDSDYKSKESGLLFADLCEMLLEDIK